jgi:hypothetical protein
MDTPTSKKHRNSKTYKSITLLFLVCFSGIFLVMLSSNLEIFCTTKNNRLFNISNEELFFISSVLFIIINIVLLKLSRALEHSAFKMRNIVFIIILVNQLLIAFNLFMIYVQIKTLSHYYIAHFYTIIYASLVASGAFLAIAGIQFLRWFVRGKNYLVMIYGLVMIVLFANSLIATIYLSLDSLSHRYIIKRTSCSVMISALNNPHPELTNLLTYSYDISSFFSFILAWLATVLMLKAYSKRKNRFAYWIIVSLPLIFFLSRYEVALYFFSIEQAGNILASIDISSDVYGYDTLQNILNSNLQLGGIFFGIAFFAIALKLGSGGQQRKAMIITGIGIMFLFGSKDISTLIITSYPPLGAVSIAFTGLASYLTFVGIYIGAKLTARDKKLRSDLREKIENNMLLLKSIATSQDHIDTEKNVKHLMNLSTQWKVENEQQDMTQEEIREVVKDVISELKSTSTYNRPRNSA